MPDRHDRVRPTVPDRGLLAVSAAAFAGFLAILVTVGLSRVVDPFDSAVASEVQLARVAGLTGLARVVTDLGSFPAVVTVAAAAIVGLWVQTHQLWWSAILASAVAATASLVTLLKIAVARSRPHVASLLGHPAVDLSFPSGHTTNGSLVYVLATLLLTARLRHAGWRRTLVAAAVVLAVLIGLSRVYLGYHWATDVLAGWLLASGVVAASYFTSRRLGLQDPQYRFVASDRPAQLHGRPSDLLR